MPRKFVKYLDSENIFYCKNCRTQIACLSDVAAQSVHPSNNSAYIFCHAINLRQSVCEDKNLLTGKTAMVDVFCNGCEDGEPIGWRYVKIGDPKMKFKQGKFLIERCFLEKIGWIDGQDDEDGI